MKEKIIFEKGIPVGNIEKKYSKNNILYYLFTKKFQNTLLSLVNLVINDINSINEIGCGEGENIKFIYSKITKNIKFRRCDFSSILIENLKGKKDITFYQKSIYELDDSDSSDLILCLEVLEHLEKPEEALDKLNIITNKYLIISVPNEPLWRILNIIRFKYIKNFGNTPGHIQHFSKKRFINLLKKYFKVLEIKTPLPWIMVLCKKV